MLIIVATIGAHKSITAQSPTASEVTKYPKRNYYSVRHRMFVSFTPTALNPIMERQELRVGFEYHFNDRIGIALDAGPVFAANGAGGNGFAVHPQVRWYGINYRVVRWFVGAEVLYRHQHGGAASGDLHRDDKDYVYDQDAGRLNVFGGNLNTGFTIRLFSKLTGELYGGIGIKQVSWERENLRLQPLNDYRKHGYIPSELTIADSITVPYLGCNIKVSWLLGKKPH